MRDPARCPDMETLAAFLEGSLVGDELRRTRDHVCACDACLWILRTAAEVDRDNDVNVPAPSRRLWLAAAASMFMVISTLAVVRTLTVWQRTPSWQRSMAHLVAASTHARDLEPRLSGGFRWAPLRPAARGGTDALDVESMKRVGAAGVVLEATAHDDSVDAKHAAAKAQLLVGRSKDAAAILKGLATGTTDPRVWSDLAAAYYNESVRTGDVALLLEGLAATDAALRLDPRFSEALFNRALIVEQLGLRDSARSAWRRFIAADPDSGWAREAQRHLAALSPASDFRDELQEQYSRIAREPALAHALARRFPQDARVWGETEILARWATALEAHDATAAAAHLNIARAFGTEIARGGGDQLLAAAVAAIDRADPARQRVLAQAQLALRSARSDLRNGRSTTAASFARAARDLRRGGSPLALLADYYAANAAFVGGRIADAQRELEGLARVLPSEYPAHHAQVHWQLGVIHASNGEWAAAVRAFDDSGSAFERLGEGGYAADVRALLAEVYDRIGQHRTAQGYRLTSWRSFGRLDKRRLQYAVSAAARTAALNRDWHVSLSFHGLALELASDTGDAQLEADALLERARVERRMGLRDAAADDLARATRIIARLPDAVRARSDVARLVVEGALVTPAAAVPLLTRALELAPSSDRGQLSEIRLERGRAFAALGRFTEAAEEFEAGIRMLDLQRASFAAIAQRETPFVREELFEAAVSAALVRGDPARAHTYADRARAPRSMAREPAALHADADDILIEYAALPTQLVIFVVERDRTFTIQRNVTRDELAADVDRVLQSATSRDGTARFREAASALYTRLLEPVADRIRADRRLVFIPDGTLQNVPFAALVLPNGRYLIEEHVVVVAPSAAVYAWSAERARAWSGAPSVLLVAGAASSDGDARLLSAARREADAVAAAYGTGAGSVSTATSVADFDRRARRADVIHFVGHAGVPDDEESAALVMASDGTAERLEARDIAALDLAHVRLVVLAACATGRSGEHANERSTSLATAFLAAGVPSVVATLWPIDDSEAALFFPLLHEHLARGASSAAALRATQLECLRRPNASPAMWAAVQVIGS